MVKVAAIQMQMCEDKKANIHKAEIMVRQAAQNGARIILIPELFEGYYFCKDMDKKYFSWAQERIGHPMIALFSALAKELGVVLPLSYFEKAGERYFNSLVMSMIDNIDVIEVNTVAARFNA